MKIVHVINDLSGGGAEKLVSELALLQSNSGHQVTVILLLAIKKNIYDNILKQNGVVVIYLNARKYSFKIPFELRKIINEIQPDIIHSHLFPSQYYVVLATMWTNFKLITTQHSTSNARLKNKIFKYVERFLYSYYDRIIVISDGVKKVYLEYLPNSSSKIFKIENGIDLSMFHSYGLDKSYLNLDNNLFVITMVARFTQAKDHDTLIKSLLYLPYNFHLVLVGIGERYNACNQLVKELGLENRVSFLGFRTDIAKILSASDVVVLSSFWEGFGLSIVEGMASGKPVVATNVIGLKDIVEHYGCLFEVGNSKELSKIILELYEDKSYYKLISNSCKLRSKCFDIVNTNTNYLDLYNETIEQK